MQVQQITTRHKIRFTVVILLLSGGTLAWQFANGGVASHHLLHRADMPAISNWWAIALLPVLTWWLTSVVQKRLSHSKTETLKQVMINFSLAFVYGLVLSQAYIQGHPEISSVLFPAILAFAVFFKVYRGEYVLGFILSMCTVFGAVLPTIFATLMAITAFALHYLMQSIWQFISKMRNSKAA